MKYNVLVMCLIAIAACAEGSTELRAAEPETSMAVSELGNACTLQCRNGNIQCNATCERFPRPNCEENCDARLLNCMRACGCPFHENFDRVFADHSEPTNTFICVGNRGNLGVRYRVHNLFNRVEHWRRTLQCDGLTTESLVSTEIVFDGTCTSRIFPEISCTPLDTSGEGLCVL